MPIAGLCDGHGAVQAAFSYREDAGVVRGEALATTFGAPVVPEHVLQVLLLPGVSAGSWGTDAQWLQELGW